LETRVDLRRNRLELMLKVLDVDGAVRRVRGGWIGTGQAWAYDAARHQRIAAARAAEQELMREYARTSACRMEFLRRCLDDPEAVQCGRCDNCAGPRFDSAVSTTAFAAAQTFLGRPGVELVPRRQWPTGLPAVGVPLNGRIPPGEQTEPGRVLGRLSDLGWGDRLRPLLADGAPDSPVPPDVAAAMVEVLKDWAHGDDPWRARPVAVVTVQSYHRPLLITSLAGHIAEVGRIPLLGVVGAAPSAAGRANSAQRVRALHGSLTVGSALATRLAGLGGPVLLIDDLVDSGWTMALAARLLRQAGVPAVLPMALALAG
jgi:ATP-dependent DNA helicase RecQ